MLAERNNILVSEQAQVARAKYPYALLALLGVLVVSYKLFVTHGLVGFLMLLFSASMAVFGILCFLERSIGDTGREKEVRSLCVAFLILVLLLGEFGSSTESSITFLISIWKMLTLLTLCFVLRKDSMQGFVVLRSIVDSPIITVFALTIFSVLVTAVLQFVVLDVSTKGFIRAITFYGSLLAAMYCTAAILRSKVDFSCARTVFRCVLLALICFAVFEMISGFHLPTSWLNGDDPTAIAKQNQIAGRGIWITATGPCYNQNDFCLILAVAGCLSLPSKDESCRCIASALTLLAFALILVASLGSTIVSIGMLVAIVIWSFTFQWRLCCKILCSLCAAACVFFFSEVFFDQVGVWAELVQGPALASASHAVGSTAVLSDFVVQGATYEQGYGSMWMRLTLYQQLVASIGENPLGVGPASMHSYLTENPTASGLIDPHNWWFEFALEYGWIPAVLYVLLNALLVVRLLCCRQIYGGYALSICAALCAMYIGSIAPSSSDFNVLLWIPVLMGCAFLLSPMPCSAERSVARSCFGANRLSVWE